MMKLDKKKFKNNMPVITIAVILLVGLISLLAVKVWNQTVYESVDKAVADYLAEVGTSNYVQSDVQQMGDQFFVAVRTSPSNVMGGEEFLYLLALERKGGVMVVSAEQPETTPNSAGVNVRKVTCGGNTVIFGTVNDNIWPDLSQPVVPVDFTSVKILYSGGKELETSVSNFLPFMLCIKGNVYIDEVLFMSKKDVAAELSKLPLTDDVIGKLNSCKSLSLSDNLPGGFGFFQN